jgi:4-hydroxybenzoate polyprenyltransferase
MTLMANAARLLMTVGRPEFLPANSASLVIGLSWGLTLPVDLVWGVGIPAVLAFATITLVAAFAAHINTLSDYELDLKDDTKKNLVEAMDQLGRGKLKMFMALELALSLACLSSLVVIQSKPLLLLMWSAAVFFAYAYSTPPLRLKSRSFLAVLTLMIVLSILPVTFVAYVFTTLLGLAFWIFLAGQAMTVYAVIIPAEIRDYFGDKARDIITMTVSLGLVKASSMGIVLLSWGGILCVIGFAIGFIYGPLPLLSAFLVVMAVTYIYVLKEYRRLYKLSRNYVQLENRRQTEEEIVRLAAKNPKWITVITQTIMFICLVLLVSKLL